MNGACPSVRIALVGKGGSGKSTIAGTLARLLARRGRRVLALDVDTCAGMSFSLGLGAFRDDGLPSDLAERREGEGWVLRQPVAATELVERYSASARDGVRLLQVGKLPHGVNAASTAAFRHVVRNFREPDWSMVGDLAAGTRQSAFGWLAFAELICIVCEPTWAAEHTVRRLATTFQRTNRTQVGLVVSKVHSAGSGTEFAKRIDVPLWGEVPYDRGIAAAEREGAAPLDAAASGEGVAAIARLCDKVENMAAEGGSA